MAGLRAEIWTYSVPREVPCLLCGRFCDQQYVAVVAFDGQEQKGDVCPGCLAGGPSGMAERLRQRVAHLRSQARQMRQQAHGSGTWVIPTRRRAAQMLARAKELLALAGRIEEQGEWAIHLADVQEAEKAALRNRCPGLEEADLRRWVEDRYRRLLGAANGTRANGRNGEQQGTGMHDSSSNSEDERQLADGQEQYRLLMDCVTDYAIFLMDADGRVSEWNAGAERMFGYGKEEIVGQSAARLFTPEDIERGEPEQELQTAKAEGRATYERWHLRQDGSRFWAGGVLTALRDDRGHLRGFIKVARDLTDRRRLEEELKAADRHKDEFLAMLGHELRHPLAPVQHAFDVLKLLGPADPKVEWARNVIDRQVQHMKRLVDDLLDMAQIRQGTIGLQKEPVELATVVARAEEMSRPLVEGRQQELTVSLPSQTLWLEADPARLAQVLVNLLHNASKYTGIGGRIRLTAQTEGNEVVLRVQDNGAGIPPEVLPQVFESFVQGEGSRGGLGLGLAVVHRLVELHGGSVTAHSEGPDKGSEFVIRLGLAQPPQARVEAAAERPRETVPCRVLLVDDNAEVAESLAMLLEMTGPGHKVRIAPDGPTALAMAQAFRPEVVLLDIGLPGMDGYEVARRLRQLPGLENVRLVAVTGYGQEEDRRRSQEARFDRHLVKPVKLAQLEQLLAGCEP